MMEVEKLYLTPGMVVRVRHNIDNRPKMIVAEKVTRSIKNKENEDYDTMFLGIKCRWFDTTGRLQEAVFNTKDLELIEE